MAAAVFQRTIDSYMSIHHEKFKLSYKKNRKIHLDSQHNAIIYYFYTGNIIYYIILLCAYNII